MSGGRDTPPSINDGLDLLGIGSEASIDRDDANSPTMPLDYAKSIARDCYDSSTSWLNAGRRLKWNDSLRVFQGLHPNGSKYLSTDYKYRSRLFRPKTRSMVRKAEAETAAAFFSNEDVVNISAQDDDDPRQQASAEINQKLLQYRLTRTIPWFLTLVGARQDAEVMGICIAKTYWKYGESLSHTEQRPVLDAMGQPRMDDAQIPMVEDYDIFTKDFDHPWVDLMAPENFRFDPAADWRDPVATSPYLIELVPMYVIDVKANIESGKWLDISPSALLNSVDLENDVTRRAREAGRIPGKDHDSWKPRDYDICWIRENIIRWHGSDWHYLSISSSGELLTEPRPLKEVYLQGIRPYTCGFIVPEAHKTYPTAKVELMRDLQAETNDVTNLRLDNVKLALNPRQFIAEGKGVDPEDARKFMPGKVIMTKTPREDVVWDRPPEVTASSYQEQDRINMDIDELMGGVSNSSIQANRQVYEAVGNMEMMQGNAGLIGEYEQRVFAETFVEKILRHLVKLEQAYETDPVILAIAGKEAKLYQKFGIDQITDDLLKQELTIRVNVGIGATNPQKRLQNFVTATEVLGKIYGQTAAAGTNFQEVTKEIFSLCGYKDGERFFMPGFDPHQQQQPSPEQQKIQGQLQIQQQKVQGDMQVQQAQLQGDIAAEQSRMQAEQQKYQLEAQADRDRSMADHQLEVAKMQNQMHLEQQKAMWQQELQMMKAKLDSETKVLVAQVSAKAQVDAGVLQKSDAEYAKGVSS